MKTLALGCLLAFASPMMAQTGEKVLSPLEQTLVSAEKAVLAAVQKHDKQTLQNSITGDFVQVGVDGNLHGHGDVFGYSGIEEILAYNFKVLPMADNVAVVSYDAVVKSLPNEDDISLPRYQRLSSLWVRQGEQWRLKFQQATAIMSE